MTRLRMYSDRKWREVNQPEDASLGLPIDLLKGAIFSRLTTPAHVAKARMVCLQWSILVPESIKRLTLAEGESLSQLCSAISLMPSLETLSVPRSLESHTAGEINHLLETLVTYCPLIHTIAVSGILGPISQRSIRSLLQWCPLLRVLVLESFRFVQYAEEENLGSWEGGELEELEMPQVAGGFRLYGRARSENGGWNGFFDARQKSTSEGIAESRRQSIQASKLQGAQASQASIEICLPSVLRLPAGDHTFLEFLQGIDKRKLQHLHLDGHLCLPSYDPTKSIFALILQLASQCHNLESLSLSGLPLKTTKHEVFIKELAVLGGLTKLQSLSITGSGSLPVAPPVDEVHSLPMAWANLQSLRSLSVKKFNHIGGINVVCHLPRLKILTVSRCCDLRKIPEDISSLTNLQELSFSGCVSICRIPESLGLLSALRVLNLSRMKVTCLPDSLGSISHLEKLDISFGSFRERSVPASLSHIAVHKF